ncbi:MAG: hypothetical protein A3F72_08940 [Bacteroidetes bacterium RIFCSPLOWO2_12_FULL_35_15]|nr:MAG: hypothetical protein A3F72_08940 [Bacteroidetes bacterium RIFCSPLOWO2_12_FULL_35_15]
MKKIYLLILLNFIVFSIKAQTGLTCATAVTVIPSATCNYSTYTTSATEMWGQFVATSPTVSISLITAKFGLNSTHIHNLALISGTCSNQTIIAEDELPFVFDADKLAIDLDASGLIVGNTYYLRAKREATIGTCDKVNCKAGGSTAPSTYQLCVQNITVIIPADFGLEVPSSAYSYLTNRGQLLDVNNNLVPDVKLYTLNANPNIYIANDKVSYVFSHIDTIPSTVDSMQRVDMTLVGANTNTKTFKTETAPGITNFFLSHLPNGVADNKSYNRTVSNEVYPFIDMQWYSNNLGEKIYFIVRPSGDADNIVLKFDGATSVTALANGGLKVITPLGNIEYEAPHAYQINPAGNVVPMPWQANFLQVTANSVKFDVRSYPHNMPLFIQVDKGHNAAASTAAYKNLTWSTYYGGNHNDKFSDIVTDAVGDVYTALETVSNNFPVITAITVGSSINNLGSNVAGIVKFNKAGVRQFATLYGVTSTMQVPIYNIKLDVDSYGNTFLVGEIARTPGVTTNIPFPSIQPAGAYVDPTYSSGYSEVFLTKFNTLGNALLWTTYFGSTASEYNPDVNVDFTDDVYLTFQGFSDSLFQKTGAYWNNAYSDSGSVIVKFNSSLQRTWATGFKGRITRGAFDKIANFYITGSLQNGSINVPWTDPGGSADFDTTLNGKTDAFVARFSKSGSVLQWLSSFGGNADDIATSIAIDNSNNIYITGHTQSSNFPYKYAGTGTYCDSILGGTLDAFMFKYGANLDRKWGSYFGGASSGEQGADVATDPISGRVFFTGYTTDNAIPFFSSTPYYSQSFGGGSSKADAYILTFSQTTVPIWGSYLGYTSNERGLALVANHWNQMFLVGYTSSAQTGNFLNINPGGGAWFINTYFAGDGNDCHISRFTIDPTNSIGINEYSSPNQELAVYPNPSNGQFNYIFSSTEKMIFVKVYNLVGQLVFMDKVESKDGLYKGAIDMASSTNGVYFIVAETSTGRAVKKIVKQ